METNSNWQQLILSYKNHVIHGKRWLMQTVSSPVIHFSHYLSFSCPSGPGLSPWIHGLCSLAWPALHCGLWTDRPPREAPRLLSGHSSPPGCPSEKGGWKEKNSVNKDKMTSTCKICSLDLDYINKWSNFRLSYWVSGLFAILEQNPPTCCGF